MRFGSRCPMGLVSGKGILDSLESWFQGDRFSILCQWDLYPRFLSLAAFRNPWAVFWIPEPRVSNSTSTDFPSSISAIDILSTFLRANRLEILDRIVTWIHVNESYSNVTRDDLQKALQHCCDIVSNGYNIVPTLQRCVAVKIVPCYITFKQQRRRWLRKRHLKSEFAPPQTLSRLFHLIWFNSSNVGKLLWSWILKDCFKVREKEEKTVVLCSRPRQNVKTCVTAKKCAKRRDSCAKLFFFANENLLVAVVVA